MHALLSDCVTDITVRFKILFLRIPHESTVPLVAEIFDKYSSVVRLLLSRGFMGNLNTLFKSQN